MNISEPFIRKPVATTLLTLALALAGGAIVLGAVAIQARGTPAAEPSVPPP